MRNVRHVHGLMTFKKNDMFELARFNIQSTGGDSEHLHKMPYLQQNLFQSMSSLTWIVQPHQIRMRRI